MSFGGQTVHFLLGAIDSLLMLYQFALIAAVLLSWVNPDPYNPIVRVLHSITDPLLDFFRRFIPMVGMIDLSPLVALLLIQYLRSVVMPTLGRLAA